MLYINPKKFLSYLTILSIPLFVYSCKPKDDKAAKQAQLEKMKKEDRELQQKISTLEKELNVAPASKAKGIVSVIKTKDTIFKHYVVVQGKVESEENIQMAPKVPGAIITNILVTRGQKVKKGQVLATQESGAMVQSMEEVKNSLDMATTVYKKQKSLWDQKIGSEIQYLNTKTNMISLQKRLATMQEQLSNYTMRSPIDGTIDDYTIKTGEIPGPASYVRIVNYNKSKVVAEVSESYVSKINVGDQVLVQYPDINRDVTTRVRSVTHAIDPSSRTIKIEADPGSKVDDLRFNMIAIVKINDYSNPKARVVPVNLVQNDEKGQFIYVIEQTGGKNIVKKRVVTIGQTYNGETEILKGLNDSDLVISSGYQNVVDGQEVNI